MSGNAVARYARSAATALMLGLVTLLAPTALAQAQTADGDLDTSFSGDGKVFVTLLGHNGLSFETPEFQKMVLNGVNWVTG